jgi:hypothetical protein
MNYKMAITLVLGSNGCIGGENMLSSRDIYNQVIDLDSSLIGYREFLYQLKFILAKDKTNEITQAKVGGYKREFYMGQESSEVYAKYGIAKCNYPARKDFYTWTLLDKNNAVCSWSNNVEDIHNFFDDNDRNMVFPTNGKVQKYDDGYMVTCLFDNEAYKAEMKTRNVFNSQLHKVFTQDLKDEYCPDDMLHLFDIMYSEAWDRGHSAGFSEVASYFSGIVDFTQRIVEANNKARGINTDIICHGA